MRILTSVLEISRSEALTGRKQFQWFDVGELAAELAESLDCPAVFPRPAREMYLAFGRSLGILATCIREAPEFGRKKMHKAAAEAPGSGPRP